LIAAAPTLSIFGDRHRDADCDMKCRHAARAAAPAEREMKESHGQD